MLAKTKNETFAEGFVFTIAKANLREKTGGKP